MFNQRDLAGILRMIRALAALAGKAQVGERLAAELQARLEAARDRAKKLPRRPRVYFEEWNDPLISGIRWVSELIEAAGEDCFAEKSRRPFARERAIPDAAEVMRRAPDIIVGSWCGRKFQPPGQVRARAGWEAVPAVRDNQVHEIKSADILAPGPAAITEGLAQLERIVADWAKGAPGRT